ncbi:hypothetical protein [Smaragdicoccus niigatensis]|uniref:hypothetical protein n=1 Tax=Smaragdicoccus niigatensis TaxID=359359 RepID=UPI00037A7990|nr:hypothetical protein [Smaragdicoccus niigatensis]
MWDEYAFQWLTGGTGRELDAPQSAADAAHWARDVAARAIDGQRWLADSKVAVIDYSVHFRDENCIEHFPDDCTCNGPGAERLELRLRKGKLSAVSYVLWPELRELPESSWPWRMLEVVFDSFKQIGEKYNLGQPPLRDPATLAGGQSANAAVLPKHTSTANVSGEFDGLEDDEILVVAPYMLDGEDMDSGRIRRDRVEAHLVENIGPISASSAADATYTWSVQLPESVAQPGK